jgi:hypothetical protein
MRKTTNKGFNLDWWAFATLPVVVLRWFSGIHWWFANVKWWAYHQQINPNVLLQGEKSPVLGDKKSDKTNTIKCNTIKTARWWA